MGMLMPVAGLIKVRYNGDKADIDSSFFKVRPSPFWTILNHQIYRHIYR